MPKEFRDWRKVMLFYIWDFVFYVNSIKLSNFAQNIFNRNKYDISTTCMLKFVNGNNFWKNSISISFFFSFERYGCLQVITDWFSVDHLFLYFSLIGLASPYWISFEYQGIKVHSGLWKTCATIKLIDKVECFDFESVSGKTAVFIILASSLT